MEDPFLAQKIQNAYDACASRFRNETVLIHVGAQLLRDGILTTERWEKMNKLAIQMEITDAELADKRRAEQEATMKEMDKPDSKYYKLYNHKNGDLPSLLNWFNRIPLKDHKEYLAQLKDRPIHFRSLFKGDISGAILWYENQIRNREAEELKQTAKPETATEKGNKPLPYSR